MVSIINPKLKLFLTIILEKRYETDAKKLPI